jgi:chromosome partitioning protein
MARVMVPFANGKGGVGKSALACSYAVVRAQSGADVILTDLNEEQKTALTWARVRESNGILPKIRVEGATARRALEMIGRQDVLVVDTPGWTDRTTLALARQASVMVVPTGPNPTFDLEPTVRLLHGLMQEGIQKWRVGVVLSRFRADGKHVREEEQFARAYLQAAGYDALPGCVRHTPVYGKALAEGYGLTEVDNKELAAEAMQVMDSITTHVLEAERQLTKLQARDRASERDRGGRSR